MSRPSSKKRGAALSYITLDPVVPSSAPPPTATVKLTVDATLVHKAAGFACLGIAVALGICTLNGKGPTPDISMHFDSGTEYNVHEAKLTWIVLVAAAISGFAYLIKAVTDKSAFWMPFVVCLLVVDLLALARVRHGQMLIMGGVAGFFVSLTEHTSLRVLRGGDGHWAAWWLQAASVGGWAAILETAWYTAAWSEHNAGSVTPDYVIPLMVIVTVLLALTKVVHLAMLYGPNAARHPIRSEVALAGMHLALLAVVGFVPML